MKKFITTAALLAASTQTIAFADSALTTRQADEVRSIVAEALADAEARTTLLQSQATAGINGGNIYLSSADQRFLLNIGGQVQFRYVLGYDDSTATPTPVPFPGVTPPAGPDGAYDGFDTSRAKIKFSGHVGDPRFTYVVNLATSSTTGNVTVQDAYVQFDLEAEGYYVKAGQYQLAFAAEELIDSSDIVAVERSLTNEYFTLNRSEAVAIGYADNSGEADTFRAEVAFSDGANSGFTGVGAATAAHYALTARANYAIIGDLDAFADNRGSTEEALRVGGGVHYEDFNNNLATFMTKSQSDALAWTVDAGYKAGGFGILGAIFGAHDLLDSSKNDAFGLMVEVDYVVPDTNWDVFGRYEIIDDSNTERERITSIITFGGNYTFSQNVRFTSDLVIVLEPQGVQPTGFFHPIINGGSFAPGVGFASTSNSEDKVVWRNQIQLTF